MIAQVRERLPRAAYALQRGRAVKIFADALPGGKRPVGSGDDAAWSGVVEAKVGTEAHSEVDCLLDGVLLCKEHKEQFRAHDVEVDIVDAAGYRKKRPAGKGHAAEMRAHRSGFAPLGGIGDKELERSVFQVKKPLQFLDSRIGWHCSAGELRATGPRTLASRIVLP